MSLYLKGDVTNYMECACYYGESAKNMHCRSKEHVSKFNSKSEKVRSESAFYKHLLNTVAKMMKKSSQTTLRSRS